MDFTALATAVITYISLGISAGFLEEQGKEIYQKAKGLLKPDEIITLNLLEKYPENKDLQGEAVAALESRLKENPDIARELSELIKQLKSTSNRTSFNYQQGETNFNIQNSENSQINFNKK